MRANLNQDVIMIDIQDREDIYNRFDQDELSKELGDYLLKKGKKLPFQTKLTIDLHLKIPFEESEISQMEEMIHRYFHHFVIAEKLYFKYGFPKKMILFLIGTLLIILSTFISKMISFVLPELFLIAGWVAIWEAVDNFLFKDISVRLEMKRAQQLKDAKVIIHKEF